MANAIDLVVGKEAIQGLNDLISKLEVAHETILKVSQDYVQLNKGNGKIKGPSGLNNQVAENAKLTAELQRQSKIISGLETSLASLNKVRAVSNKMTAEESVNQRILNKNAIDAAKANSALVGSYDKLSLELIELRNNAKNVGATFGETSKQFAQASVRVNELDTKLKKIDLSLGQSSRMVGSYGSSFNGLGNSINQITRELPAFTFSAQTGFLALSNNIPILKDEIDRLKKANIELAKSGEPTVNVTKQIISAFLSWNTVISVGITLFTVYGKEIGDFFKGLFSGISVIDSATESLKQLNEIRINTMKSVVDESVALSNNLKIAKNYKLDKEERLIAVKNIQDQYPFYFKNLTTEQILLGQTAEAQKEVNKALLSRARANAATEKITASQSKIIDLNEEIKLQKEALRLAKIPKISGNTGLMQSDPLAIALEQRTLNNLIKEKNSETEISIRLLSYASTEAEKAIGLDYKAEKSTKEKTKAQREYNQSIVDYLASAYALQKQQLTDSMNANKAIADDESINFEDRKKARFEYLNYSIKIAELDKVEQLRLLQKSNEEQILEINENAKKRNEELKKSYKNDEISLTELKENQNIVVSQKNNALYAIEQQTLYDRELIYQNFGTKAKEITKEYEKNIDDLIAHIANKKDDLYLVDEKQLAGLKLYSDALKELNKTAGVGDLNKFKELEDMKTSILENADKERANIELAEIQRQIKSFDVRQKNSSAYQDLLKQENILKTKLAEIDVKNSEKEESIAKRKIEAMESYLKSFSDSFGSQTGFSTLMKTLNKEIEGFGEDWAVTANTILEIGQETFKFLNQSSQYYFNQEKERAENQRNVALEFAGESVTAREEIERQYDERRKKIERQQAEAKKKATLFNIVVDTAQAIIATLAKTPPPAGIPLALLVGAIGAAQLAIVSSQQIPAFAEGGTHDGGLMLVNDAKGSNYRETIVTPDGKISRPEGRNLYLNAPKGTEIYTQDQWNDRINQMLMNQGIMPMGLNVSNSFGKNDSSNGITRNEMESIMKKTISKIPQSNININVDENGFKVRETSNGQTREKLNSRLRMQRRIV